MVMLYTLKYITSLKYYILKYNILHQLNGAPANGDSEHGDEGPAEGVEVLRRLPPEEGLPHHSVCAGARADCE